MRGAHTMHAKTLLYIELPPPMHGMTYINLILKEELENSVHYQICDTNFTSNISEVGKISLGKIWHNFRIIKKTWCTFFYFRPKRVYMILSATHFGIIRDTFIVFPPLLLGRKLFVHLHGFTYYKLYNESRFYRFIFDTVTKNADLIVLCDEQKIETDRVMNKTATVLFNCTLYKDHIKKRSSLEVVRLCYISNISHAKGTFALIDAVKQLDNVELVIAGNFLSEKEAFFDAIEGEKNIRYVGFADEQLKEKILMQADIFCLPSKLEEGSPISIIEAMRFGLPILSTSKGCIPEMISKAGYILRNDFCAEEIKEGLEYIKTNYAKLSQNSLKKFDTYYSRQAFIAQFKAIIERKEDVQQ